MVEARFQDNAGNWNIQDIGLILGAAHTPKFDELMTVYRGLQKAVEEDESRVRRLPRPWFGDPHHRALKQQMNTAKAKVMEYLLAHKEIIIIHGR